MVCKCGEHVESGREKLGIKVCLACGEAEASIERRAKAKRVSLAYPKGPYMYQGGAESAVSNLRDSTDTRRSTAATLQNILPVRVARALNAETASHKPLGVFWSVGEHPPKGGTIYYSENDPGVSTAIRKIPFR